MTEQKRTKIKTLTAAILVIYVAGSLIGLVQLITGHAPIPEPVSQETFVENAQVQAKTEVIGSNIRLLQAIYGMGDEITYRYSVETDCPSWDYEDRYTTTKPLTWVSDTSAVETFATNLTWVSDTSAVETFATNIAVWYDGTMYASDQHYEVPLLDLSTRDRSLSEMESDMVYMAYPTYVSDVTAPQPISWVAILIAAMVMVCGFIGLWYLRKVSIWYLGKAEPEPEEKAPATDGSEDVIRQVADRMMEEHRMTSEELAALGVEAQPEKEKPEIAGRQEEPSVEETPKDSKEPEGLAGASDGQGEPPVVK